MILIPAVDLMDRQVVRLEKGQPQARSEYGSDPVSWARRWQETGAERLHVVDLDRTLGRGTNLDVIRKMARETQIPLQVGGGIRSQEDIEQLLEAGADRVVVSTLALSPKGPEELARLAGSMKESLLVSLDQKGEEMAVRGWRDSSGLDLTGALERIGQLGLRRVIYTATDRDGTLAGPLWPEELLLRDLEVYLAGGIASAEHLISAQEAGFAGAIVGKALYEGRVDLGLARASLARCRVPGVIPCLDVREGRVVKGMKFRGMREMGDPLDLASRYGREGATRLALLFISKTALGEARKLISAVSRASAGTPLIAGGGVDSPERARAYLEAGATYISVGTAAVTRPRLLPDLLEELGPERVILAADVAHSPLGLEVCLEGGQKKAGVTLRELLAGLSEKGLQEVMVTSVDRDGTGQGYDLDSISQAREHVPWVIASGGGRTVDHMAQAISAGATSVLAASIFHLEELHAGRVLGELREKIS